MARFWDPAGTQNRAKTGPEGFPNLIVDVIFSIFLRFLRSGAFRKGPGPIPEAPEALPDQIFFKNFTILFCWFLRFFFAGCVPIFSGFVGFAMLFCRLRVHLVRVYQAGHLAEAWREFPWGPW